MSTTFDLLIILSFDQTFTLQIINFSFPQVETFLIFFCQIMTQNLVVKSNSY